MLKNCEQGRLGCGGLANQVRERGDGVLAGDPIVEVLPKGETMFPAGLLEADEGIPTASPGLTAGAGTDLALLHHVPEVVLAAVVVQRQVRVVQHPQQFVAGALEAAQPLIERFAGRDRRAQRIQLSVDDVFRYWVRLLTVGRQRSIEGPHLLLDPINRLPVGVVQGQNLLQRALGVDPAEGVDEQGKLPRVIAQQPQIQAKTLRNQPADQGPFGHQGDGPRTVHQVPTQVGHPRFGVGQDHGIGRQPVPVTGRHAAFSHIGQRLRMEVVTALGLEQFQEIHPAFGPGAGQPGKPFIAHVRAVAVFPLMARPGIVGLHVVRDRQTHGLDLGFFLMKALVAFRQQAAELPRRNLDAPLPDLGQQNGLGHMGMVMLVQQVGHPLRSIMAAPPRHRDRRRHRFSGGEWPWFPLVARIVEANHHVLDDIRPIPLEPRADRYLFQPHPTRFMNDQFGRLRPLRTPATRFIGSRF